MQIQIHTEENQKEIKQHGNFPFPVYVSEESISAYKGNSFLWHWHPEIELTWIQKGQIEYCVNEHRYLLREGDGLFVNANALHSGYRKDGQGCEYLSITFHPRFIYGYENSLLQTKYVDFITANPDCASLKLLEQVQWQKDILRHIRHIYRLSKSLPADYELETHLSLSKIWQHLYRYYSTAPEVKQQAPEHLDRLKCMLAYIQNHYTEAITLEDISRSVSICKSECCRFFKKHMNMTLFEYLMYFRVQQSLPLLLEGESITKSAGMVGFTDSSYFGKIFKRYMHCSPGQYKKAYYNPPGDTSIN